MGRLVYVNPAGVRWMAGTSAEQITGHMITDFVHPASIPPMLARIAALKDEGDSSEPSEMILRRLDGGTLDVEAVSVLTRWEGRPAYQVVFRDLTAQKTAEATLRYQAALVSHVTDAIVATTADGMVASWNPAAENIYARPAAEVIGRPVAAAVGADLDPADVVARGGILQSNHWAADGSALAIRVSAARMDDDGYVLVCTDYTALRRAEQHFRTVVTSLDEGVIIIGRDGTVASANPAARRILGVSVVDAFELPILDTEGRPVPPETHPVVTTMRTGLPCTRYVFGVDRADGRRVWLRGSCALLNPADAENSPVVASFSDITDQRTVTERLAYEATHDSLTGLPNRGGVLRRAADALDPGSADRLTAVLFIDLDGLKQTNDSLGHTVGDRVLQAAASRLRATVRRKDMVGRLGGDEFVALLFGEITPTDVDALADRLSRTLAEPVTVGARLVRSGGASIGVVLVEPEDPRTADDLLRDADLAMYEVKEAGRR